MKIKLLLSGLLLVASILLKAQEPFEVLIEPMTIANVPSVHSYSIGHTTDGKWIIVGGRIEGLHQRQPFAAFKASENFTDIAVIDPVNNQSWVTTLSVLPASIYEQLQSTNQQFYQRGTTLYIMGGYGYSNTETDHVTYANLTAIDIDGVANALINSANITSYFRQISDSNLAVTGGQLGYHNNTFYLCGGQYFKGRYNPMGPNQGPGFTQQYTDEIRKFEITDDGTNLAITNYSASNDTAELHRRDYNMSPQIFPDGTKGFTMFSGVFNIDDLPFLNTVDITDNGYVPTTNFNQYLSNYHSAKTPIYDQSGNVMHTIFFGGMSQYTMDANGNLVQDDNVPFVKTISKISRFSDSSLVESKLDIEMPTLLGSGAEFMPISGQSFLIDNEIIDLNQLPMDSTLIGYIYGGIESTLPNIFSSNNGTQSSASSQVFKVYINKNVTGIEETSLEADNILNLNIYPNPTNGNLSVSFFIPSLETHTLKLYNLDGKEIHTENINKPIGEANMHFDWSNLASGEYILQLTGSKVSSSKKLIIE